MPIGGNIIAAAAGLALAACTSTDAAMPPNDASFAWGCWVSKDERGGRILAFLRLLKDGPDGKLYEGYLHDVRGSDMIPALHLSLARDGTRATVVRNVETIEFITKESVEGGLMFKSATPGKTGSLSIAEGNEKLFLTFRLGPDNQTYAFERDGCD